MPVLYRKYRPEKFDENFIGQGIVKKILKNAVMFDHIGHAYLFTGLKGSGKTTSARIFSKAVNCQNAKKEKGNPCGVCDHCKSIQSNSALDIIEIDAASNRGIDEIREIRDQVKTAPSMLAYKVYIIDEVHMLTKDAFNALLKTLEEPPAHAIFILVTTESDKIPNTILSRVQRLDFKPFENKELGEYLQKLAKNEKIAIDQESVDSIVSVSGGSSRDAISLLDKMAILQNSKITKKVTYRSLGIVEVKRVVEFADLLVKNQFIDAIKFIDNLKKDGYKLDIFLASLINYLRVLVLFKVDPVEAEKIVSDNFEKEFIANGSMVATQVSGKNLVEWLEKFIELKQQYKTLGEEPYGFDMILMDIWAKNKETTLYEKPIVSDVKKTATYAPEITKKAPIPIKKDEQKDVVTTAEVKPKEPEYPESDSAPDLTKIEEKWAELVARIKPYNNGISAFLKASRPQKIAEDGKIVVGCQSSFHQNLLNESNNFQKINEELSSLLNQKIRIQFAIDKTPVKEEKTSVEDNSDKVKTAVEIFQGKVVGE